MDPGFVGRARELDVLARGLDDAVAGRGRLFLLVGEPGIGKTALCDAADERRRGARAARAVGARLGGRRGARLLALARRPRRAGPRPRRCDAGRDARSRRRPAAGRAGPGDPIAAAARAGLLAATARRSALPPVARGRLAGAARGGARGAGAWSSTISTRPTARRCCCSTRSRVSCARCASCCSRPAATSRRGSTRRRASWSSRAWRARARR